MKRLALALLLGAPALTLAQAQSNFSMPPPAGVAVIGAQVVSTCAAGTLLTTAPGYITIDATGNLCVSASATIAFPTIGAAVPATGVYNGLNVAGTLRGWSGLSTGSIFPGAVAVVDASGNQVTSFGGTNASVSATGAAVPASATYLGISIGGNIVGVLGGAGTEAGALRVTLPTDGTGVLTVKQATAANLNATVVGTGTFPVQAASTLAAETTKVIGTVRNVGNVGGVMDAIGQNVAAPANWLQHGCQFNTTPTTITTGNGSPCQMDAAGNILVNVKTATGLAQGSTTSGQTGSMIMGAVTTTAPAYTTAQTAYASLDLFGGLRINGPYPAGATPITASATGTTGATTATLATGASVTTYLCGFSIRANATAAVTNNATVTGTITGTLNFTQWTAPNASGLGVTEMIFNPCVPASAANTSIAVVSGAPGTGGVVSTTAWGFTR